MKKLTSIFLITLSMNLYSQNDPCNCEDVLIFTGQNVSLDQKKWSMSKTIYNRYEQDYKEGKSVSFSGKYKKMLESFGFGGASDKQKYEQIKKLYMKGQKERFDRMSYERTTSDIAIQAWTQCQQLCSNGFRYSMTENMDGSMVTVTVWQSPDIDVEIQNINFNGCDQCQVISKKGKQTIIDPNGKGFKVVKAANGYVVTIVCRRSELDNLGENGSSEEYGYKSGSLTTSTNRGPITYSFVETITPARRSYNYIVSEIDRLNSEINILKEDKSNVSPDYESKWKQIDVRELVTFNHNLEITPSKVRVLVAPPLAGNQTVPDKERIYFGDDIYAYAKESGRGVKILKINDKVITVQAAPHSPLSVLALFWDTKDPLDPSRTYEQTTSVYHDNYADRQHAFVKVKVWK